MQKESETLFDEHMCQMKHRICCRWSCPSMVARGAVRAWLCAPPALDMEACLIRRDGGGIEGIGQLVGAHGESDV